MTLRTAAPRPSGPAGLFVLKKRAEFLAAARGRKQVRPTLVLQARDRGDAAAPRVGFTWSRRVGGAVIRNRAKRRLRAAARAILAQSGQPGWDYVLIGRADATASAPFSQIEADLLSAVTAIHARRRPARHGTSGQTSTEQ
ncbi:MAG: ribonuclease P protein component [Pseudomonadota bacterium]